MLTINADQDPLFSEYYQPYKERTHGGDLPESPYGEWVTASTDESRDFLVPFPFDKLVATPST